MRNAFKSGDIVEIPLPSGKVVIGWVIYVSKHFKSLIGVIACGLKGMDLNLIGSISPVGIPFYTSDIAAKHYGWSAVGCREVDGLAQRATTRIVGGEVYVGDNCVRPATDRDREHLHRMLAKGMPAVHKELEVMNWGDQ